QLFRLTRAESLPFFEKLRRLIKSHHRSREDIAVRFDFQRWCGRFPDRVDLVLERHHHGLIPDKGISRQDRLPRFGMVEMQTQPGPVKEAIIHNEPAVLRAAELIGTTPHFAVSGNERLAITQLTLEGIP